MRTPYPIELFWSDEDAAWIADVPDLPLCTAHGATPQEAVIEVEHAVDAWLAAVASTGRTIPEPSLRSARA